VCARVCVNGKSSGNTTRVRAPTHDHRPPIPPSNLPTLNRPNPLLQAPPTDPNRPHRPPTAPDRPPTAPQPPHNRPLTPQPPGRVPGHFRGPEAGRRHADGAGARAGEDRDAARRGAAPRGLLVAGAACSRGAGPPRCLLVASPGLKRTPLSTPHPPPPQGRSPARAARAVRRSAVLRRRRRRAGALPARHGDGAPGAGAQHTGAGRRGGARFTACVCVCACLCLCVFVCW
jgi:hypothetical protein